MKNNWIRFLAGALVSVMLVGAFALTGGMKGGKSTEGLLYQASGLHPDGEMLVVDGQIVTCEEYLYWVDYVCTYLASQLPDVDWNAAVSEGGITYGDYVKLEAVNAAKRFAVTRAWAEQAGIALTDGDMAALALQRQELVSFYGEEGYRQQLALMGISEETFDGMLAAQYLNSSLQTAYGPGGSLYDEDAVRAYAQEQGYASVYVLTLTGENAETMAADLLERWQKAEDKAAEYAAMCEELQQEAVGAVTLTAAEGDPLSDAIMALELEELTAVIDPYGDGSCYVILRTDLDLSVAADAYFQQVQSDRLANASVVSNAKLYSSLDVGAFYDRMTELRAEMQAAMAEAGGHTADDGHDHSADAGTDTAGEDTADTGADAEPAA